MTKMDVILEKIKAVHYDIQEIKEKINIQNSRVNKIELKQERNDTIQRMIIYIGGIFATAIVAGLVKLIFFP